MSIYIIVGICIVVGGIIWIRLIKDNAKQEKIIAKYIRDIAMIKNNRKGE